MMNMPDGLRLLAEWFDQNHPSDDTEVQEDLRGWAKEVETLEIDTRNACKEAVMEKCRSCDGEGFYLEFGQKIECSVCSVFTNAIDALGKNNG